MDAEKVAMDEWEDIPDCWVEIVEERKIPTFTMIKLPCSACKKFKGIQMDENTLVPSPMDAAYHFVCKKCNGGNITLSHTRKNWSEILATSIFNLQLIYKRKYFDLGLEITPFIENHWDVLCNHHPVTKHWKSDALELLEIQRFLFKQNTSFPSYWSLLPKGRSLLFQKEKLQKRKRTRTWEGSIQEGIATGFSASCHQCRTRKEAAICCYFCSKSYCSSCLKNHYSLDLPSLKKTWKTWNCPLCLNTCSCITCDRNRGEEPHYQDPNDFVVKSIVAEAVLFSKEILYLLEWDGYPLSEASYQRKELTNCEQLSSQFYQSPCIVFKNPKSKFIPHPNATLKMRQVRKKKKNYDLEKEEKPPRKDSNQVSFLEVPDWREINSDCETKEILEAEQSSEDTSDSFYEKLHTRYLEK